MAPDNVANSVFLENDQATQQYGEALAPLLIERLPKGGIVFLEGDLGAGKTTLVRSIIHALGYTGAVKSPTYTLMEKYPTQPLASCHFDLYRLAHPEELEFIGFRDALSGNNLCFIEWPERLQGWIKVPDLSLKFSYFISHSAETDGQHTIQGRQLAINWQ